MLSAGQEVGCPNSEAIKVLLPEFIACPVAMGEGKSLSVEEVLH